MSWWIEVATPCQSAGSQTHNSCSIILIYTVVCSLPPKHALLQNSYFLKPFCILRLASHSSVQIQKVWSREVLAKMHLFGKNYAYDWINKTSTVF